MIKGSVQNIHKFYGVREKKIVHTLQEKKQHKQIKMDTNIYNASRRVLDCYRLQPGGRRIFGEVLITNDLYYLIFKPRGGVGVDQDSVIIVEDILKMYTGFDNQNVYFEVMRRKEKPITLNEKLCLTIYGLKSKKNESGMFLEFLFEDDKDIWKDVLKYLSSKKIGTALRE